MIIETHHESKGHAMPRGGKREGTGRPQKFGEPTINTALRIPVRLKDKLAATADKTGRTMSQVMADLIDAMPDP